MTDPRLTASAQWLHHDGLVGPPLRHGSEPSLHVGERGPLVRQAHPALDAAAKRDVAHREALTREKRPRAQIGVGDLQYAGGLGPGILQDLWVPLFRRGSHEA